MGNSNRSTRRGSPSPQPKPTMKRLNDTISFGTISGESLGSGDSGPTRAELKLAQLKKFLAAKNRDAEAQRKKAEAQRKKDEAALKDELARKNKEAETLAKKKKTGPFPKKKKKKKKK